MTKGQEDGSTPDPATHERVRIRRRAHWRTQHHGPDRTLAKRIRIKAYSFYVWKPKSGNYELPFDLPDGDEEGKRK